MNNRIFSTTVYSIIFLGNVLADIFLVISHRTWNSSSRTFLYKKGKCGNLRHTHTQPVWSFKLYVQFWVTHLSFGFVIIFKTMAIKIRRNFGYNFSILLMFSNDKTIKIIPYIQYSKSYIFLVTDCVFLVFRSYLNDLLSYLNKNRNAWLIPTIGEQIYLNLLADKTHWQFLKR